VHRPKLILADEPTGNLDPATAHGVLDLFRAQSKATGAATIMVTHSAAAAAVADRVLILSDGALHVSSVRSASASTAAVANAIAGGAATTAATNAGTTPTETASSAPPLARAAAARPDHHAR
jgi:putative ABC transport system ATP-binding protein